MRMWGKFFDQSAPVMTEPKLLKTYDTTDRVLFYFRKTVHDEVLDERTWHEDHLISKETTDPYAHIDSNYKAKQKEFDYWMDYNIKMILENQFSPYELLKTDVEKKFYEELQNLYSTHCDRMKSWEKSGKNIKTLLSNFFSKEQSGNFIKN